jgi:hypothetical protein
MQLVPEGSWRRISHPGIITSYQTLIKSSLVGMQTGTIGPFHGGMRHQGRSTQAQSSVGAEYVWVLPAKCRMSLTAGRHRLGALSPGGQAVIGRRGIGDICAVIAADLDCQTAAPNAAWAEVGLGAVGAGVAASESAWGALAGAVH